MPGDQVKITMAPKGFGSENMSRMFMLKPADGIEGVRHAILTAVKDAGPNACPPMVVGVGIGGTFEKCALLAKQALTRPVDEHSDIPYVKDLEEEMLSKINQLGIQGTSHIIFIIGGSIGLGKEVLARSDYALSFSKMTFPHQLMRVILLEQIYRSYRIINGEPYHK